MKIFKSKLAQGSNYIAGILVLLIFGFFSILAYTIWVQIVDAFTTAGFNEAQAATAIDAFTRGFLSFDYVIIILMVIMAIGIGLTSFRLATRPAFAIITLIFAAFWGFIAYFFNFVFVQLVAPPVFNLTIGFFPRTFLLLTNLHWIMLGYIAIGTITLYAKKEKGQFLT